MALQLSTAVRGARVDAITSATGTNAKLRFYNAPRPADANTAVSTQSLLAQLTCGALSFAGGASGGTITVSAITAENALAAASTGTTATWFRLVTSGGATIMDGNVATSASDLNVSSTTFVSGQQVSVTSWTITDGNA
jgi:hypothetical protein